MTIPLKTPKYLHLLVILLTLLTFATALNVNASSTLNITVETSKLSYYIGESIDVFGNLTLDGFPAQNELVALTVHDPNNSPVVTRTPSTDVFGIYDVTFELSVEAPLGTYMIYVSSSHDGENATNNTTFQLMEFTIIVKTGKQFYRIGETVDVYGNLTLNRIPVQNGLVALEVQDPEGVPKVTRTAQTDTNGTYKVSFKLPTGSQLGNYTVYASASSNPGEGRATANATFAVKWSTDLTGDGKVTIKDVAIVARAFGSKRGDPNWEEIADIDGNGKITIYDVATVARDFGKTF